MNPKPLIETLSATTPSGNPSQPCLSALSSSASAAPHPHLITLSSLPFVGTSEAVFAPLGGGGGSRLLNQRKTQENYAESYGACDEVEREFDRMEELEAQQQNNNNNIQEQGTIFLKSVDASHASKAAHLLFKIFKDVVLFVVPENVVHIVMDNAANYVTAGRLLEVEFPKLCWSPCAAHCINLILQHIGKLDEVREEMVKRFQRRKKIVEPYLKILDTHGDSQLCKNLHAAGYWLNPAFRFNAEKHKQSTSGLLDVIEKYAYGNPELNSKLTSEMRIYKNVEDNFGRQSALHKQNTVMPDGNGNIMPLAFALIEGEIADAWNFFLSHLRTHVVNRDGVGLIFDCHESIISAVGRNEAWQYSRAIHMFCIKHIASNFLRSFKALNMQKLIVNIGYLRTMYEFNMHYQRLCEWGVAYKQWLDNIPSQYALAYDDGHR
ncbi:hypothetical protein AHAS_Ahas18G0213500 [Arachis hypogaea]